MKKWTAKRVAVLGVFTALSLIMFMIESLLPPIMLPGAKLGLSNIFSLLTLFVLGPFDAIILVTARTVLGSLIMGSLSSLMFSLTAGLISIIVTIVMYRFVFPRVSIIAMSVLSAVVHNIVQTTVFCLITATMQYFSLLIYLVGIGAATGAVVGVVVMLIIKYIPANFMEKLL